MKPFSLLLGALCAGLISAAAAPAATLDVASLMSGLNLVVLNDANLSSINHVEGTAYVGGNLTSGTIYANSRNMASVTIGDATGGLIVGGDIDAHVNDGGSGAIVAGGSYNNTGGSGPSVSTGVSGIPVAEMIATFDELSDNLATLASTGVTISGDSNNVVINALSGTDGVAVLNLTAAEFESIFGNQNASVSFNVASGLSLVINVAGTDLDVLAKINTDATTTLFNFYEATTVDFGSGKWGASVLAPYATLTSAAGGMDGTIVAYNLVAKGEFHPFSGNTGYAGTLPQFATAAPVPVPASLPLVLTGLGALVLLRRRLRRKSA